jgi:nicotinamide-nucleotide amidase
MENTLRTIASILSSKHWLLSTAESCTGGLISGAITEMAGSSGYFKGSVIAYSNEVKSSLLNVPETILLAHGAVSRETVEAMVLGVCGLLETDCAISVSGVAGPGGGTAVKPVGRVFIGIKIKNQIWSYEHHFDGTRTQIRKCTVNAALLHLLTNLQNLPDNH